MNKNELAEAWIKLQSLPQDSTDADELMWAAEDANMLSITSPSDCWDFTLEVICKTDDEWVLTNLAAGPLENLLSVSPDETIAMIEKEIPSNPKLRNILKNVWQNLIPENVWSRLQKLM